MLKDIGFGEFFALLQFIFFLQISSMFVGAWILFQVVKIRIKLGYTPYGSRQFFYKDDYTPLCKKTLISYRLVAVDYDSRGATLRETFYSIMGSWITCEHNDNDQKITGSDILPTIFSHFSVFPTSLFFAVCTFIRKLNSISFGIIDVFPKDIDYRMISFKYFIAAGLASFLSGGFTTYFGMLYVHKNHLDIRGFKEK
jgi:hypothetical protein